MTSPFIIWTMRRTGGTSFANILENITEYKIQHEPFNWDRIFGFIAKNFQNDLLNYDDLQADLQQHCIDKRVCIKHCYEVSGEVLNEALIDVFAQNNYKHIFLLRRDEFSRLLSLYTAIHTDVWGKHGSEGIYAQYLKGEKKLPEYDIADMKKHLQLCHKKTNVLKQKMRDRNIKFLNIYYEDLYVGSFEERQQFLRKICDYLKIPEQTFNDKTESYKYQLMKAKQKSNALYDLIPNLKAIEASLATDTAPV